MHCRASGPAVLDARHLDGRPVGYLRPFVRLHHRVAARVPAPLAHMRYLSVCSGIEAASCAWHPLGWEPVAFSEIEAFPSAVLAHHYPDTPNWGDMTQFQEWPDADVDVLVGGTPCQSFSVAGLRKGLADPRGNLMLTYLAIAARYRPTWVVWENVPGVLSSNGGRDFGTLLGGLGKLGYGFAYRILDAQYFGVAQRRRRVFVVRCLGDWRRAAAVLLERASMSGHSPPCRKTRKDVAHTISARPTGGGGLGTDLDCDGGLIAAPGCVDVAPTMRAGGNKTGGDRPPGTDVDTCDSLICISRGQANAEIRTDGGATALTCLHEAPIVAHSLRAEGFDASEDGTGRGTPLVTVPRPVPVSHTISTQCGHATEDGTGRGSPLVPVPFDTTQITSKSNYSNPQADDPCHPLAAGAHPPAIAFSSKDHGADAGEVAPTLRSMGHDGSHANGGGQVAVAFRANASFAEQGEDVCGTLNALNGRAVAFAHQAAGAQTTLGYDPEAGTVQTLGAHQTPAVAVKPMDKYLGGEVTISIDASYAKGCGGTSAAERPVVSSGMQVRRPTPRECERLQGFPDDYTLITVRGKPAADGPRYKALGNSMAVPCMAWIGRRIAMVEALGTPAESPGSPAVPA